MRVTIVGCSGSFPGPDSPASCYLVQAEQDGRQWSMLLDLGNGALGPLQRFVDPVALDAILLSHLHPDHCLDLTGLYVMTRYRPQGPPERRIPVYGPPPTAERMAYAYHGALALAHSMSSEFDFAWIRDGEPFQVGPFTITPRAVRHPIEAYGFRVEAGGQVLAYTGDTDTCDALGPLLTGAGLVLTDCAYMDGRDTERGVHLTGSRAAEAAVAAGGVSRLMLTHMPVWNDPAECRAQAQQVWPGVVELARPGASYLVGAPAPSGPPDGVRSR